MTAAYKDYGFTKADPSHMCRHFMPHILAFAGELKAGLRVLDVGCGNGAVCGEFIHRGCRVVGIDLSQQGIEIARRAYPQGHFEVCGAGPGLLQTLGEAPFDLVVSTEVVEHLYAPREWAQGCFQALKPGGHLICTTPYHGYLKNLVLALAGKWERHADPLWDGGHIKIWSKKTLGELLREAGFVEVTFRGAGRLPWLWMTMVARAKRPESR